VWPEYADDEQFRAIFAREVEAARKVGGFHTAQETRQLLSRLGVPVRLVSGRSR
jgi:hypothetical protein